MNFPDAYRPTCSPWITGSESLLIPKIFCSLSSNWAPLLSLACTSRVHDGVAILQYLVSPLHVFWMSWKLFHDSSASLVLKSCWLYQSRWFSGAVSRGMEHWVIIGEPGITFVRWFMYLVSRNSVDFCFSLHPRCEKGYYCLLYQLNIVTQLCHNFFYLMLSRFHPRRFSFMSKHMLQIPTKHF